jgi:hypothetical protein
MNPIDKLTATVRSLFHRLLGQGGSEVIEAGTLTGKFHTIYIASETTISAVVGGGATTSWLTTLPAGTTLTTPAGAPITSITTTSGIAIAYS